MVEKLAERLASYPKLESWQARASSTSSRMTSDWKPLSVVRTEKVVPVDGPYWSEEILSATDTRGGRTKDITKDAQKEAAERAAKQRRSPREEQKADQRSRGRRSLDMGRDEVFPFGPDKRSGYDFALEGTSTLDGAPAVRVITRAHRGTPDGWADAHVPFTTGFPELDITIIQISNLANCGITSLAYQANFT